MLRGGCSLYNQEGATLSGAALEAHSLPPPLRWPRRPPPCVAPCPSAKSLPGARTPRIRAEERGRAPGWEQGGAEAARRAGGKGSPERS